jgi:hypothetical protein
MSNIGNTIGLGKMGMKPTAGQVVKAQAAAKKKIGDLSYKPSDAQKKAILASALKNVMKGEEKKEEPASNTEKYIDKKRAEIDDLVEKAKEMAKKGGSRKEVVGFWNKNISPKIDSLGGELGAGANVEMADELFDELEQLIKKDVKKGEYDMDDDLEAKLRKDKFLIKCYGEGEDMDKFIKEVNRVVALKGDKLVSASRDYGKNVYELGEFYSRKFPKNANNTKIPKATQKLISELLGGGWELMIYDTGDTEAYGKFNDVVMVLMK